MILLDRIEYILLPVGWLYEALSKDASHIYLFITSLMTFLLKKTIDFRQLLKLERAIVNSSF